MEKYLCLKPYERINYQTSNFKLKIEQHKCQVIKLRRTSGGGEVGGAQTNTTEHSVTDMTY